MIRTYVMCILAWLAVLGLASSGPPEDAVEIVISTRQAPPEWALKERLLLRENTLALDEFYRKYWDDRGWYKGYLTWGIGVGADDVLQNFANYPLVYGIGGGQEVLDALYEAFRGQIEQFNTQKVEAAPEWKLFQNDFMAANDAFHLSEQYTGFNQLTVADPNNPEFRKLALKFGGFFLNEDLPPGAEPIYDFAHNVIRSGVIGSMGALMRVEDSFWGFDWQTIGARGAGKYWRNVKGDTLMNLETTIFVTNAYLLSGDRKYRDWVLAYIGAWCARAAANGDIFPSNAGLSGIVGEEWEGRWWPHWCGDWRMFRSLIGAAENATLVSQGDPAYMDAVRRQIHALLERGLESGGARHVPSSFDGEKWTGKETIQLTRQLIRLYLTDFREDDLRLIRDEMARSKAPDGRHYNGGHFNFPPHYAWLRYLLGENPQYAVNILDSDLERVRSMVHGMRQKRDSAPSVCGFNAGRTFKDEDWERNTEASQWFMPVATHALVNLACGGVAHDNGKASYPVLAEVWHFDPEAERPGLPPDVAALVDTITRDTVGLHLVNVSQTEPRTLVVQAGAYGENQCLQVVMGRESIDVNSHYFVVQLEPGCGGYLRMKVDRFANQPRARLPWQG